VRGAVRAGEGVGGQGGGRPRVGGLVLAVVPLLWSLPRVVRSDRQ
jgi:hypothetical protein